MSEAAVGRAGFDVKHYRHGDSGAAGDRRGLLYEAHRDLDPEATRIFAAKNPNIVVGDTHLNVSLVNDGAGGWRRPASIQEIVDYGDARTAQVARKISPRSQSMTTIVAHLPKSMCTETPHPNDPNRSRWVATDPAEARRYFDELVAYLGDSVLSGGQAAIHGYNINVDESTPHIQILADAYGPVPGDPGGALRVDSSRTWYSHRDVRDNEGRQMSGKAKMRAYQSGLRAHMIQSGFPVERDVSDRSMVKLSKGEFEQVQDARREAEEMLADVDVALGQITSEEQALERRKSNLDDFKIKLGRREKQLDERSLNLDERERNAADREAELAETRTRLQAAIRTHNQRRKQRQDELEKLNKELEKKKTDLAALETRETAVEEREAAVAKSETAAEEIREKARTEAEAIRAHARTLRATLLHEAETKKAALLEAEENRLSEWAQKLEDGFEARLKAEIEKAVEEAVSGVTIDDIAGGAPATLMDWARKTRMPDGRPASAHASDFAQAEYTRRHMALGVRKRGAPKWVDFANETVDQRSAAIKRRVGGGGGDQPLKTLPKSPPQPPK